ncbi:UDP-N-acetylmuramoyl-tripeptide--D-alanyl-D-alanine ligase [Cohnella kolymensis]|uniref:UDP-N-acetylmuramoyl-tripeptide--D-alanyl-D-alanine ligase n=1 Tax=Cohnella kolymensis TaxID=1590652 RepID=A0ABR5A0R4_9BACL|nr:UDP-N-acetylmuramoyl-tripeptide--D-alanyl-D-alanine ligase [Cohnella kolymensis]
MMQATVLEVAEWCGAERVQPGSVEAGAVRLTGVSTDTRRITEGQLFVPLRGDNFDGHDYIQAARDAGAAASLWEAGRELPDTDIPLIFVEDTLRALQTLAEGYLRQLDVRIVAVTGSNGKTTTKDLISSVLATRYRVHKTEGNYNNHIGLPLTILSAPSDTEVLVLEMGMSGRGEIALLSNLAKPDIAVITNIGEAHLLQLGSRRNIARAKLEIIEGLQPGGALVYYGDEPLLFEELEELTLPADTRLLTFGEGPGCSLAADSIRIAAEGTAFSLTGEPGKPYELPIPGKHNAINALAAVAVGRLLELARDDIFQGLKSAKLTGMRIERSMAKNGAVILNDAYNASPTSVKAAIDLVAELTGSRRKWIVLGDMLELGPEEAEFHAETGRYLSPDKADRVLLYGPLSANTYEAAGRNYPDDCVFHFKDKSALTKMLLDRLSPEDLVLVKASRGMKMEEVVNALQKGAGE